MASNGNSVGSLYISLGLSLADLESGFVEADRTVAANISRLNRESNLIRLRSEVEIAGLDETADAERILQIRTDALNRQMAIQRDRVRLVDAELQNLVQTHGASSVAVQRLELRLERERLSLANLEREARSLNDTSGDTTSSFSEFSELLPAIPTRLQAISAGIGIVTAGMGAAAAATNELLNEFRELNKQSYELNMPFANTRDFLRQMRLAGGDIGDYEGYIRGITDAYVKGEYDDPEFIALRKYGAQITDATGRLKSFKDISDEVYQAWRKADAAGEGIEFLQLTGGEAGVRDAIQYFKRLEEAKEDAAKIFTVKIDDEELHKLDRTMNLVMEQSDELKNAIGSIFTPISQTAAENFFQVLHDGTEYIDKNKDAIQSWGFVTSATLDTIADKLSELSSYNDWNTGDADADKRLNKLLWQSSEFNEQALWGSESPWSKIFLQLPRDIADEFGILDRAEAKQKAYNSELEETKNAAEKAAEGIDKTTGAAKENGDVLSQYGIQRVKQFKDELEDLQIELDFGDNDYEKSLAQLDLWRKRELTDKNFVSSKERAAIEELYSAKLEQIEQERADRVAELNESITSLYQTELEKRLSQIEKEKQAWIDKCDDEVKATQLAEQQKADAQRNAAMQVIKQQLEAYKAYQEGGFAGLRNYRLAELEKSGVDLRYLNMTPDQLMAYQRANQVAEKSLLPNFMTATDIAQYWQQMQQQMLNPAIQQVTSQSAQDYGIIYGDQVVSGLQNFNDALNQTNAQLNQTNSELANFSPMQEAAEAIWGAVDAQKAFADSVRDFPADYFRQLADGTKSVSEMQLALTESTMKLIEAQDKLAAAMANMQPTRDTSGNQEQRDGIMRLAYTSDDDRLRAISDIPRQSQIQQRESGLKLGFDTGVFGDLAQTGLAALALMSRLGAMAPHPVLKAGALILGGEAGAGLGVGTAEKTLTAREPQQVNESLKPFAEADLSGLVRPVINIDGNIQSLAQKFQGEAEAETLNPETFAPLANLDTPLSSILQQLQDEGAQELFGTLPNIEAGVQDILLQLQAQAEAAATSPQVPEGVSTSAQMPAAQETMQSFEVVVAPLNNIAGLVGNILSALENRQPPQITISPNNNIDLGGAYVFDNAMKTELVNDIMTKVVDEITAAVRQGVSSSSYNFSA